jgi:hypothetical protein
MCKLNFLAATVVEPVPIRNKDKGTAREDKGDSGRIEKNYVLCIAKQSTSSCSIPPQTPLSSLRVLCLCPLIVLALP